MPDTAFQHPILRTLAKAACWLALLFWLAPAAHAQGWLRHYPSGNGEEPRQLVIAANGDFVFGGVEYAPDFSTCNFYLQRNDANGNLLWYRSLPMVTPLSLKATGAMNFIERCPDGGFVAGGGIATAIDKPVEILYKVSEAGDWVWTFMPDPLSYGFLNSAIATPDGKLLVGGTRETPQPALKRMTPKVYKLDPADGSVIWSNTYDQHPQQLPEFGSSLLFAPDGSILQTGLALDSIFIRHLDADGNLLQETGYAAMASSYPLLRRAESDGFTYFVRDAYGKVYFRRYNYQLQVLSEKTTPDPVFLIDAGTETANDFAFTITSQPHTSPALVRMDFAGNISAPVYPMDNFSLSSVYHATNVKATPDGGLLFIGANEGAPTWFALKTDSSGHVDGATLQGLVFRDDDLDCSADTGAPNLQPVTVRATDQVFGTEWFETTDSSGHFAFQIPTGDYDVVPLPPGGATGIWAACPPESALLATPGDSVLLPPLGLQPLVACPYLQLDIGAWLFRPCSTTVVTVRVLNAGPVNADSSTVMLEADPVLTLVSSTAPLVAQDGNRYWFETGPVAALQSVTFSVSFAVDCAASMGQVVCVDGHVSPDSLCAPPEPLWDGSELKIRAICDSDSIQFRVSNVGAGGMDQARELVIIEDYIILRSVPLQLPAGGDTLLTFPNPEGRAYYARIRQSEGYPGDAFAADGKDFCNASSTAGMLLQYPLFAGGPFDARFCDEVRTSFDPNDKRGFPLGYGPSHYIDRGTPIRYLIRFQNTGNDTAFVITVRDTLPAELDRSSLEVGTASHPFVWNLSGTGELSFRFANILLPDSTTNEPASHGFVQFSIRPKTDLPAGTEVLNRAAIYFDANAPVFTEYARHTVDSNFIPVRVLDLPAAVQSCSITPNPASDMALLEWELPGSATGPLVLRVTDVFGRLLRQEPLSGRQHRLQRGDLPAGICLVQVQDARGLARAVGKVVWLAE
ncbi:MAG: carboxypeptidase regulatory-like domain-containing protein [Saprospiraceae bacterium]|nr:carboxypeptidase regulatory-like domain-containing protein [Saprospiraceae bacterium]